MLVIVILLVVLLGLRTRCGNGVEEDDTQQRNGQRSDVEISVSSQFTVREFGSSLSWWILIGSDPMFLELKFLSS
ncbi:hypothetical protein FRX31_030134 [Thalictrum thalictroides]|uniref:Secreted protein n=1 Tax=Thalictrum thalictroides TaxID=46969 RepID=A0A7J6V5C8_THATH|nr:hypothetical protein FRX31_030134 [Thalictrum thalictroides]